MDGVVQIVVALIMASGAALGPIAVVLIQKSRREQATFRQQNDEQHGMSMDLLRDIRFTTLDTRADLRELRRDFEQHLDDHLDVDNEV